MYKIKKIRFQGHPVLKNLELDFCGLDGNPVDTVIIAGENGTGKSTIINELYKVATHSVDCTMIVDVTNGSATTTLTYSWNPFPNRNPPRTLYVRD